MHAALIILPACAHINVRDSTKRIYIVCSICNEGILSPLPVLFFSVGNESTAGIIAPVITKI